MKKIFSIIMMALVGATMLFSQVVLTRGGKVIYDVALEDACNIEHDLSDEAFSKLKEYYYKTLKR